MQLNRNFDYNWDGPNGSSTSPTAQTYRGPSVESEPETKAVSAYFRSLPNAVGGLDLHTFSASFRHCVRWWIGAWSGSR